jgi:hypothetical protein
MVFNFVLFWLYIFIVVVDFGWLYFILSESLLLQTLFGEDKILMILFFSK